MPRRRPARSVISKQIEALVESTDFIRTLKRAREAVRAENQRVWNERRQEVKRAAARDRAQREQARIDSVMEQALLRVLHVRTGTWRASDIEPCLAPLGSSLDPRKFGPNYNDIALAVDDLVITDEEGA